MTPRPVEQDAPLSTDVVQVLGSSAEPDEIDTVVVEKALSGMKSPTASGVKKEGSKKWSLFGGKAKDDGFVPHVPIDPEYYERTGEPHPKFFKRYLSFFGRKKGPEMFRAMLKWRAERGIDTCLDRPYPEYCLMKQFAPHFTYGVTKSGVYVSWEMTGQLDLAGMSKAGMRPEDIEYHMAWNNELVRESMDNGVEKAFVTVMDMKGFSVLRASNLMFLTLTKSYGDTMYKYYPEALERVLVINPPPGVATIYKIMMAAVPGIFGDKTVILSDMADLQTYIDADQIPLQYGGTNPMPLEDSPIERHIREVLSRANAGLPVPTKIDPSNMTHY